MHGKRFFGALIGLAAVTACGDPAGPAEGKDFTPLFNTLYSNVRVPAQMIVTDSASWAELWATISSGTPQAALPKLNFARHDVIAVAIGERRRAGFRVAIQQVEFTEAERIVHVLQTTPAPNCSAAEVITTPLDAAVVSKSSRPTRFQERMVTQNC